MVAKAGKAGKWSSGAMAADHGKPLAVTLTEAVTLLGIARADVRRLCRQVQPYVAADGTLKWSYRELCRALGDTGRVVSPD